MNQANYTLEAEHKHATANMLQILRQFLLKLFYYKPFFLKLGVINIHDINIKKCSLQVSTLLKWGIFTGCTFKVRITFKEN